MSTPQQTNAERGPTRFAVGYHQIHADVSLNYQMNRFSTGTPEMIAEMREVAQRIRDYTDYIRAFLGLSDRALQMGELLKGAYYLRSAELYMLPDDPRKQAARREFVHLMRECFGITSDVHHSLPYGSSVLSSYRLANQAAQGTIVLFGGFDSYIEELFPLQCYLREAGFDVITFEGPGQGAVLDEGHLTLTPDWERPVSAVLDYFQLDDVTWLATPWAAAWPCARRPASLGYDESLPTTSSRTCSMSRSGRSRRYLEPR